MGRPLRAMGVGVAFAIGLFAVGCELVAPVPDLTSGAGHGQSVTSSPDGGAERGGDVGAEGGAGEAGMTSPCMGTFLYCNSFEVAADLATFALSNVNARIDTSVARVGVASVRLDLQDTTHNGDFTYKGPAPIPDHVFVRVLTHFAQGAGNVLYLGRTDYTDAVQVYVGQDHRWHLGQYGHNDVGSSVAPDLSAWHCAELELDVTAKVVNAWFDGSPPISITLVDPKVPFARLALGESAAKLTTVWFDEFAIATQRIGCP